MQSVDEAKDQRGILLQEGTVVAAPRDALRTSEIEVYGVGEWGGEGGGREQVLGVVGAKLHDERPVEAGVAVEVEVRGCELGCVVGVGGGRDGVAERREHRGAVV